jgi:hypothetical protein
MRALFFERPRRITALASLWPIHHVRCFKRGKCDLLGLKRPRQFPNFLVEHVALRNDSLRFAFVH